MNKYNYYQEVKNDVLDYIRCNEIFINEENRDEIFEQLNDELWTNDSVTGNGSGSYTLNTWEAEEYLCHNFDLLAEALREFGCDFSVLENSVTADVTIRCYILGSAINDAIDEIISEQEEEENEVLTA